MHTIETKKPKTGKDVIDLLRLFAKESREGDHLILMPRTAKLLVEELDRLQALENGATA